MTTEFSKPTDGFFARHFDRQISGAISRQLLKTSITPNQVTILVTLLGVFAGYCLAQSGYRAKLIGSLLFLLTSILDGCDGEIARAKKMTSRLGGWLDLLGDNVVHVAAFYGLGLGLFRDSGNSVYLMLGKWAVIGTVVSAALASIRTWQKLKQKEGQNDESLFTSVVGDARAVKGPTEATLVKLSDALARRDFIYGVVLLALIGRLEWFLWPCAIGVNLYALILGILFLISTHRSE